MHWVVVSLRCKFHLAHQCLLLIPMYTIVQVLTLLTHQKMFLTLVLPCLDRNCFDVHINIICKKCTDLAGCILRTFTSRDSTTLMTLVNALILSRLDYCSQLWLHHLIRHIIQIERVQHSFTKCITGMCDCSYSDRLSLLRLYSLQRRRNLI